MKLQIFAIFDQKAKAFLQPFFFNTEGEALRALTITLHDPNHQFAKFPGDYTLFALGEYNQETGEIEPGKQLLTSLLELKAQHDQPVQIPDGGFQKLQEVEE